MAELEPNVWHEMAVRYPTDPDAAVGYVSAENHYRVFCAVMETLEKASTHPLWGMESWLDVGAGAGAFQLFLYMNGFKPHRYMVAMEPEPDLYKRIPSDAVESKYNCGFGAEEMEGMLFEVVSAIGLVSGFDTPSLPLTECWKYVCGGGLFVFTVLNKQTYNGRFYAFDQDEVWEEVMELNDAIVERIVGIGERSHEYAWLVRREA